MSDSSPISSPSPAQTDAQSPQFNFPDNIQELLGSWEFPPIDGSSFVLDNSNNISNSSAGDSLDFLSDFISPLSNFPPNQVPTDREPLGAAVTYEDIFGIPVEGNLESATITSANGSFNSTDILMDADDNSFDSITGLFCDDGNNSGAVQEEGTPTSYTALLEDFDMSGATGPSSSNPGNSSYLSLPDFNTAQDGNAQEPFPGSPEEEEVFDLDIMNLIPSDDSDDPDYVDETPTLCQPRGQVPGENDPIAEAAPNAYHSQQPQFQLENNGSQSGPVGAEADGVRHISRIAQQQTSVIGPDPDLFCYKCLHPGHQTDGVTCPAGRIETLMDPQKETFYTLLDDGLVRQKLLVQDLRWIAEGLNWGIDMAEEGVLDGLGILPSSLLYLKELLLSWKSASKSEEYTLGPLSGVDLVVRITDIPSRPSLASFQIVSNRVGQCGEAVKIDETQQSTPGLFKVTKSQNVREVSFASLVQGNSVGSLVVRNSIAPTNRSFLFLSPPRLHPVNVEKHPGRPLPSYLISIVSVLAQSQHVPSVFILAILSIPRFFVHSVGLRTLLSKQRRRRAGRLWISTTKLVNSER